MEQTPEPVPDPRARPGYYTDGLPNPATFTLRDLLGNVQSIAEVGLDGNARIEDYVAACERIYSETGWYGSNLPAELLDTPVPPPAGAR